MILPIYIGSDHDVTYEGAYGGGGYLNSATVTFALKDSAGTTVSGGTGTLSYVAASSGNYAGVIQSSVTSLLTNRANYTLEITFVQSAFDDFRRLPLRACYRERD